MLAMLENPLSWELEVEGSPVVQNTEIKAEQHQQTK